MTTTNVERSSSQTRTKSPTSIMQQQIELELADQYDDALDRARKYVKSVVKSSWLSPTARGRAYSAEGQFGGLVRRCLCFIIENEDIDKGLSEFGNYIQREYATNRNKNVTVSLKPYTIGLPVTLGEWATQSIEESLENRAAETLFGVSPERSGSKRLLAYEKREVDGDQHDKSVDVNDFTRTANERKLFQTYGDTGSLAEAIKLLGWSEDYGRRMWSRVHQRVKRYENRGGEHADTYYSDEFKRAFVELAETIGVRPALKRYGADAPGQAAAYRWLKAARLSQ